jgi:sugar lactone lactonase YvrE
VSNLAGNGRPGNIDGNDTSARFSETYGIAIDAQGNVFVADQRNDRVRKITPTGSVSTFAQIHRPSGVAIDLQGNVYVSGQYSHRIYKIGPTGLVSTFAGNGTAGFVDGSGTSAQFNGPQGITIDAQGNVFVADEENGRIRKITSGGIVSTLASIGHAGFYSFSGPTAVAVDAEGNVFVVGGSYQISKITSTGGVSIIAGRLRGYVDGNGTVAEFTGPAGIAVGAQKNIYVTDYTLGHIRKISLK